MKELEALRELQHELMQRHNDLYCDGECDKQSLDIITKDVKEKFELIAQAITPPTVEEVCEKLSEYLGQDVKISDEKSFYYKYGIEPYEVVGICGYEMYGDNVGFRFSLPPHLITLIGRFYEGMEKKDV